MSLSVCERRTIELAADGLSNREIARRLGIQYGAVRRRMAQVCRKAGISAPPARNQYDRRTVRRRRRDAAILAYLTGEALR